MVLIPFILIPDTNYPALQGNYCLHLNLIMCQECCRSIQTKGYLSRRVGRGLYHWRHTIKRAGWCTVKVLQNFQRGPWGMAAPLKQRLVSSWGDELWAQEPGLRKRGNSERRGAWVLQRGGWWLILRCMAPQLGPWSRLHLLVQETQRREFDSWVRKIPWRRAQQPPPVFLPGESQEQRSLAGYSS